MLSQEEIVLVRRQTIAISVGSVLSVVDGLAGIVVGFLLLILGILGPAGANSYILSSTVGLFLNYFRDVLVYPTWQAIIIGFIVMILGCVDITAGFYLWRRSKTAAVVSVAVASVAGGIIGGYLIILALVGPFLYLYLGSVVVKLVSIGYGWRNLHPAPPVNAVSTTSLTPKRK